MTPAIEVQGIDFAYPDPAAGRAAFAIRALGFTVGAGEIFGVIGPNASGKTTLIRLLSRVLEPDRGEIRLEGRSLRALARAEVARAVAVVPQDVPADFAFTVADLVLMGRFPHAPGRFLETRQDRLLAEQAMDALGVRDLAAAPLDRLSGGERQRALLARALCQRPRILVLDEPTAHLDLRHQAECVGWLRRLNRESGLTVVLVSHDLSLAAEVSDRLLLMQAGRGVRVGPPGAVLEEGLLASVYGCRVAVDKHPVSGHPAVHVVWPDAGGR